MAGAWRRRIVDAGHAAAILGLELLYFQPIAPLRHVLRFAMRRELARLAPHFDADLYLRQIAPLRRRKRAARDPLVHYALLGWREFRSPNRRFDPRFYREDVGCGRIGGEPLVHYLAHHESDGTPQNEVEATPPPPVAAADAGPPPAVLVLHHSRGGGSSQYLALFEARMVAEGLLPIRLRLVPRSDRLVLWGEDDGHHGLFDITTDGAALLAAARRANVRRIVVSHTIDFDAAIFPLVEGLAADLGASYDVILHDYFSLCLRVNLVDGTGTPCPIAPVTTCVRCVSGGGSEVGRTDPWRWRDLATGFASRADRVVVPSHDARTRLQPYIGRPIEAWLPETDTSRPPLRARGPLKDGMLSVVVLGSVNVVKGSDVLLRLARRIKEAKAPIRLTVIGEAVNTPELREAGVTVSGRYRLDDVRGMIDVAGADVVFLPAICPETWSFVLSIALDMGLPVAAFAHGAPFERLARLGRTDLILPLGLIGKPDAVFETFLRLQEGWERGVGPVSRRLQAHA